MATNNEIFELAQTYQDAQGTPTERDVAEAFVNAVLLHEDNLPRMILDQAFWAACAVKKLEKPQTAEDGTKVGNRSRFVHFARNVVALRKKYLTLSESEQKLTESQISAYAWAVYAVATKSDDEEEVRASAKLFERIYSFRTAHGWVPDKNDEQAMRSVQARVATNFAKIEEARAKDKVEDVAGAVLCYHAAMQSGVLSDFDAQSYGWTMVKRVWKRKQDVSERDLRILMTDFLRLSKGALSLESENARKIRHWFLIGVSKRIHDLEKQEAGGTRAKIPYEMASVFMQIADENCGLLQDDDFTRRELTPEDRARMYQGCSKKRQLKAWPSNVETLIGVAAHCVKAHAKRLKPGAQLLDFLGHHLEAGEWFSFHYGQWLKLVGRGEEAAQFLLKTVESKKTEAWAWICLAESYAVKDAEKARACYCRALLCPIHDENISVPMARSTHWKLAKVLQSLHEDEVAKQELALAQKTCHSPLPGQADYYRKYENEASRLLLAGKPTREFKGDFERTPGKDFGFVLCGPRDEIFVPPPLAKKLPQTGRIHVKGVAVLKPDPKKNRNGWAAEELQKI